MTDKILLNQVHRRLKIIEGQVKKISEMVIEDSYCIEIINQSKAVQSALREIDYLILKNHLQTCMIDNFKKNKSSEFIDEFIKVSRKI